MPRKKMTEEERKAFGEKMKAAKANKQPVQTTEYREPVSPEPQPEVHQLGNPQMQTADVSDILRRLQELEQDNWRLRSQQQPSGPQAGQAGLIGTYTKYKLDPTYYPDPRQRLSAEPRLQRFAFPMNYELEWTVGVSSYKTIDGINTREPKFTLELVRIIVDEDTGLPTNGRYIICRAIFHEDPEAALVVARENGVQVDESDEKAFLDEMRYLRMRDWLLEAFYPPKPQQEKKNKKDMVIGGKLVEYFEINSENSESVPFSQLTTKL